LKPYSVHLLEHPKIPDNSFYDGRRFLNDLLVEGLWPLSSQNAILEISGKKCIVVKKTDIFLAISPLDLPELVKKLNLRNQPQVSKSYSGHLSENPK
jgi:hypothetical protein